MRMDFAMLSGSSSSPPATSRTSLRYPPIAAAAPMSVLPEQAASWAYPQPGHDDGGDRLHAVTGLLGRLYLTGHLQRLSEEQRSLVGQAVVAHKAIRAQIATSVPGWPLGLPSWDAEQLALALSTADETLLTVWHRGPGPAVVDIPGGPWSSVTPLFPVDLPGWHPELRRDRLRLTIDIAGPTARTYRLGAT